MLEGSGSGIEFDRALGLAAFKDDANFDCQSRFRLV
jgi:hypothetical protein